MGPCGCQAWDQPKTVRERAMDKQGGQDRADRYGFSAIPVDNPAPISYHYSG